MAEFTNDSESSVCPVCSRRSGPMRENAEIIIKRCEEHKNILSTAEIYAKGMTVGNYNKANGFD